jgi:GntR family transcriptional regulator, transcriptional repressor for pyruvate dehydrogenase complex
MMKVGQAGKSDNLVEVREILEPEIAALAAERATDEHIAALQEAVEIMDAHLDDADTYIAADNDFHRALAKATQNDLILAFVDSIVDLLSEQRKHIFSVKDGAWRGQIHHKLLLDTVRRHDPDAARTAMSAHLHQVRADVKSALAQ